MDGNYPAGTSRRFLFACMRHYRWNNILGFRWRVSTLLKQRIRLNEFVDNVRKNNEIKIKVFVLEQSQLIYHEIIDYHRKKVCLSEGVVILQLNDSSYAC